MFKIDGLDKLTRDLEAAQKALSELDGELGAVGMDPHDVWFGYKETVQSCS